MERLIRPLREALAAFVEQREKLHLLLTVKGEGEVAVALKLMEAAGQQADQDLYLLFGHSAPDSAAYMDALMADCALQIDAGNRLLEAGGGDPGARPWAPLPAPCLDPARGPDARFRDLVKHIRRHRPDPRCRIVFGFLPIHLDELSGYWDSMRTTFAFEGYEPWMAGVRVVLLDLEGRPELGTWVRAHEGAHGASTVARLALDLSPAALVGALAEEARDPEADPEARLRALLQLAGLDYAHGRLDEALAKYGAAYARYRALGSLPMQGVCLLGAGQTHARRGEGAQAAERLRQALEAGVASESLQLIVHAAMSLAALHQEGRDFEGAARYWLVTAATARRQGNLFLQADAMEQQGLCRLALEDPEGAGQLWAAIPAICAPIDYRERAESARARLTELEQRLGHRTRGASRCPTT